MITACKCEAVSATEAALNQMTEEVRRAFLRRIEDCPTCARDRKAQEKANGHS